MHAVTTQQCRDVFVRSWPCPIRYLSVCLVLSRTLPVSHKTRKPAPCRTSRSKAKEATTWPSASTLDPRRSTGIRPESRSVARNKWPRDAEGATWPAGIAPSPVVQPPHRGPRETWLLEAHLPDLLDIPLPSCHAVSGSKVAKLGSYSEGGVPRPGLTSPRGSHSGRANRD